MLYEIFSLWSILQNKLFFFFFKLSGKYVPTVKSNLSVICTLICKINVKFKTIEFDWTLFQPFISDEPIIHLLIDWSVSTRRSGIYRAVVVAKLLEKRQFELKNEVCVQMYIENSFQTPISKISENNHCLLVEC